MFKAGFLIYLPLGIRLQIAMSAMPRKRYTLAEHAADALRAEQQNSSP
jgi:hypothetical protein